MNGKTLIKVRGLVSLMILVLFLIVAATGILLAVGNGFKGARLHTISGFLLVFLVMVHLGLNYKMLITELKALFGRK